MKNFNTLLALFLLSAATLSCNKKGCSDPTADNYRKNVKKAQDKECEYNGEGICGEGITFCFKIDNTQKTGNAVVSSPDISTTRVFWSNGFAETSSSYMDLMIDFPVSSEDIMKIGPKDISLKNFQANSYTVASGVVQANSGTLTVKKNDSSNGIIATFELTLDNGVQIKSGNIYKAK